MLEETPFPKITYISEQGQIFVEFSTPIVHESNYKGVSVNYVNQRWSKLENITYETFYLWYLKSSGSVQLRLIPNSQDDDLDALTFDWSIAEITSEGMVLNMQFWDPK